MGYEYRYYNNKYNFVEVDNFQSRDVYKKQNKNDDSLFIFDETLSKKEVKKLKIKSKNLSSKLTFVLEDYYNFSKKVSFDLEEIKIEYIDVFFKILEDLDLIYQDLVDCDSKCNNLNVIDEVANKLESIRKNLKSLKKEYNQKLLEINDFKQEEFNVKIEEYNRLLLEAELILDDKLVAYSKSNLKLSEMINNTQQFCTYIDKEELLYNLEKIKSDDKSNFKLFNYYKNELEKKSIKNYNSVEQVNAEINNLNRLINKISQINIDDFLNYVFEQEKVYEELEDLNNKFTSGNVEMLLKDCEKYFNRPMFLRQLKKYNLEDYELDIVKKEIEKDIINQVITEDNANFKKIIKIKCKEFREVNSSFDENEINNLLNDVTFVGVDEDIIIECKNKVKKDFLDGNITINQVELKFKNYVNKKIDESNQLKELDRIKNNPNVPSIKIHLTPEENDEIYKITETEILSVHGINGSVENRVYYQINQKIRDNQSIARGRLNSLKREFSNLTQLSKTQQLEFVYQIEFYISENKLKPSDITEENIIVFSKDFKNNGELNL